MKSLYTKLLLLVACVMMGSTAWAYTLPTATMDLKTITSATMGTWSDANSYYLLDDYLLVSAASSRASVSNQKWITYTSAGTANTNLASNWVANSPFKGSTEYTNQNYVTIQANRCLVYRVKNCKSVGIYGKNNGTTKYLSIKIYEVTDGTASTTAAYTLTYTTDSNPHIWSQTLDANKEYVIDIEGVGTSNSQVYELAFERNAVADTRLEPELRLSETELYATVGDTEFAEPTVYSDGGYTGSYEYSSSKPAVASVNATTGEVSIGSTGKTTITISVPSDDANYKPRSISYTITVVKAAPVGATFYESFDQFEGNGGNDGTWSNISTTPALGTFDNTGWTTEGTNYSGSECVSIRKNSDTSKPSGLTTPAIGVAGDGHVKFMAESWGTDGATFYVDIVGAGTFVAGDDLAAGNISNAGKTAKVAMLKTGTFKTYDLDFTGLAADSKFRFYAPANKRAFLDEVAIWVTPVSTDVDVTIGASCYATLFSDNALTVPTGVTAYTAVQKDANTVTLNPIEDGVIPANTGVVLKAEAADTYTFEATADVDPIVGNLLTGSVADDTAKPAGAYALGIKSGVVGFYPYGGATLTAGKAYLVLPSSASVIRVEFADEEGISTGVGDIIDEEDVPLIIHTLKGRLVKKVVKDDFYIVNMKSIEWLEAQKK